jgi:hypothetical protein
VPKAKQRSTTPTNDGVTVGYEARLWQMADALRGSMDAKVSLLNFPDFSFNREEAYLTIVE